MHVKVEMDDFMQAQEAATESGHFHPTLKVSFHWVSHNGQ